MSLRHTILAATAALALATPALAAAPAPTGLPGPTSTDPGRSIDAIALKIQHLPRDRQPSVFRDLKRLGPAALDPMLARLASDSPAMATLRAQDPAAAKNFDAALLEAVGAFRTPKALPALKAAFEGPRTDPRYVKAAADALGRLCEGGGFQVLAAHAIEGDRRDADALRAIGLCRTPNTAKLLVNRLATATDETTLEALANGIGQAGSSWAWQAMGPAMAATAATVQQTLADALVNALSRTTGHARTELRKALLMVDEQRANQHPR